MSEHDETVRLRAELDAEKKLRLVVSEAADRFESKCEGLRAAARQDADIPQSKGFLVIQIKALQLAADTHLKRAAKAEALNSQDAEEIARLREALKPFAMHADDKGGTPQAEALRQVVSAICETPYPEHLTALHEFCAACREASAALDYRPQPARNRPLPETRCDCCDNGLDDAWEFCPFCGQQHPDATGLACRPQEEKS